jgi:hypothetical protein
MSPEPAKDSGTAPHKTFRQYIGIFISRVRLRSTTRFRLVRWLRRVTRPVGVEVVPYAEVPFHPLTKQEYFHLFRDYRIREHDILNHRLTWNLTVQGFLFVTYGYCVQKLAEVEAGENGVDSTLAHISHAMFQLKLITRLIPLAGLAMSVVMVFAVITTYRVLSKLQKEWNEKIDRHEPYMPNPSGAAIKWATLSGLSPPLLLPVIFILAWIVILFTELNGMAELVYVRV